MVNFLDYTFKKNTPKKIWRTRKYYLQKSPDDDDNNNNGMNVILME